MGTPPASRWLVSLRRSRCHPAAGPPSTQPSSAMPVLSSRSFQVSPGSLPSTPRRKLGRVVGCGESGAREVDRGGGAGYGAARAWLRNRGWGWRGGGREQHASPPPWPQRPPFDREPVRHHDRGGPTRLDARQDTAAYVSRHPLLHVPLALAPGRRKAPGVRCDAREGVWRVALGARRALLGRGGWGRAGATGGHGKRGSPERRGRAAQGGRNALHSTKAAAVPRHCRARACRHAPDTGAARHKLDRRRRRRRRGCGCLCRCSGAVALFVSLHAHPLPLVDFKQLVRQLRLYACTPAARGTQRERRRVARAHGGGRRDERGRGMRRQVVRQRGAQRCCLQSRAGAVHWGARRARRFLAHAKACAVHMAAAARNPAAPRRPPLVNVCSLPRAAARPRWPSHRPAPQSPARHLDPCLCPPCYLHAHPPGSCLSRTCCSP